MCIQKIKIGLSGGFCIASTLFILTILGIMYLSHKKYMSTQEAILNSHKTHLQSVESYVSDFNNLIADEYGKIVINTTRIIDTLNNVPSKKQYIIEKDFYAGIIAAIKSNSLNDESTFNHQLNLAQKELLLNQQNLERLLELHYAELDNQQMTLTIWAAVLSIIFLTFGFFAIFKIEESKEEAQAHLEDTANECNKIISEIQSNDQRLQNKLTKLDDSTSQYDETVKEINVLISSLKLSEDTIKNRTESVNHKYNDIDSKLENIFTKIDTEYKLRFEQKEQNMNKLIEQMMKEFYEKIADIDNKNKGDKKDEKSI